MRILGILWLLSAFCACNALKVTTRKRSVDFFLDKRKQSTSSLGDEEQEEGPFLADQATSSSNENRQSRILKDSDSERLWRIYDSNGDYWNDNRRSFRNSDNAQVGFSATRASRDAQLGRRGPIRFDNTLSNFNQGWNSRDSIFQCRSSGLHFFTFSARGRWNYGYDDNYIESNLSSEESRRIRLLNLRSREADREACFDWKVSLMLNSEPVISIGGTNNTSGSNSIILPLNRGDRVYLQLLRGQLIELNDSTYSFSGSTGIATFSGYKIASNSNNFGSNNGIIGGGSGGIGIITSANTDDDDNAIIIPARRRDYYGSRRRYYYGRSTT